MDFKRYLEESARSLEAPVTDDSFAFHINESLCIETSVVEHSGDSIVVHVDDRAMQMLEALDLLETHDRGHNSPYDRGGADAYYGRNPKPHKWAPDPNNPQQMAMVMLTDPAEIEEYMAGYREETGRKDYGEAVETEDLIRRKHEDDDEDRTFINKKKTNRKDISELLKLAGMTEDEENYADVEADGVDVKTADLDTLIDAYVQERDEDKAEKMISAIRTRYGDEAAAHADSDRNDKSQMIPAQQPAMPVSEAEYQGHSVQLGKPTRGDVKKYKVFVKNPSTGKIKKVNFGDKNMEIKRDNPERRKNFRARHNCSDKKDRTKAGYWSCRMWSSKPVSKIV